MAKTRTTATRRKQSQRPRTSAKKRSGSTMAKSSVNSNGSMLETFFMDALKDIYWAEKALTKTLPRMTKAATSPELKKALQQHLDVTQKQIGRLDKIFQQMGKKAQAKKCEAMQGLIDESEEIISETKDDTFTRDAALIISAQKVEHYEIAAYGGLAQLARTMNKKGIASLLMTTLNEEKKADVDLTRIAEKSINVEASREEQQESPSVKESFMNVFS